MATSLSDFLTSIKRDFLTDMRDKKVDAWNIVMGNEAGDLDSVASSVAFSYLESRLHNIRTIALVQTPRPDLRLRPENLYAFDLASVKPDELLCFDDLTWPLTEFPNYVIVDHNTISSRLKRTGKVIGIIDHHADDGNHRDAAFREITVPTGSCSSLVTRHFQTAWAASSNVPPEVATLLLTAMYIDTGGLKPDDKAQQVDYDSRDFLVPRSTFAPGASTSLQQPDLSALFDDLNAKKQDVSQLSTGDLLRRDYKEYALGPKGLLVGLATVPVGLKAWADKDKDFWRELDAYMAERKLSVLGILTTYRSEKKAKHKREILMLVDETSLSPDVENRLLDGLQADPGLELEAKSNFVDEGGRHARVWNQGNVKQTRKQVAPLVKRLVEGSATG